MKNNTDVFQYNFEWDPKKDRLNFNKHDIHFERAAYVFSDKNALTIYDYQHSEIEERWITLGIDNIGVLLVVFHTFKKIDKNSYLIRLISARKATKKETLTYFGGLYEKRI